MTGKCYLPGSRSFIRILQFCCVQVRNLTPDLVRDLFAIVTVLLFGKDFFSLNCNNHIVI